MISSSQLSQLRRQYSSVQTYPYGKCQGFIEMVLLTSVSYIEVMLFNDLCKLLVHSETSERVF
jgi:hypothetical protein